MATRKVTNKQRVDGFAGQMEKVFLAGLGIVANARKTTAETFDNLVRDGEKFRKETSKKAEKVADRVEDSIRDASEEAQERAEGFVTRLRRRAELDKIEKAFDKRVADAMDRMNVPSKNDVDMINKKLNRILRVVDVKEGKTTTRKAPATRKKAATAKAAGSAKATESKAA